MTESGLTKNTHGAEGTLFFPASPAFEAKFLSPLLTSQALAMRRGLGKNALRLKSLPITPPDTSNRIIAGQSILDTIPFNWRNSTAQIYPTDVDYVPITHFESDQPDARLMLDFFDVCFRLADDDCELMKQIYYPDTTSKSVDLTERQSQLHLHILPHELGFQNSPKNERMGILDQHIKDIKSTLGRKTVQSVFFLRSPELSIAW